MRIPWRGEDSQELPVWTQEGAEMLQELEERSLKFWQLHYFPEMGVEKLAQQL